MPAARASGLAHAAKVREITHPTLHSALFPILFAQISPPEASSLNGRSLRREYLGQDEAQGVGCVVSTHLCARLGIPKSMAGDDMVVDHAHRLHEGVSDGRAYEFESFGFEGF